MCICDEEECNKECECEYDWCTHSTTTTTTTTTKPAPTGGIKCYQCQGGGLFNKIELENHLCVILGHF